MLTYALILVGIAGIGGFTIGVAVKLGKIGYDAGRNCVGKIFKKKD